jgi:hypothetical protein
MKVVATKKMIIAPLVYDFGGGNPIIRLLMQHSSNLAAKAQDHKSPDQR